MKSAERIKHWESFLTSFNDSGSTHDSKTQPREDLLHAKGRFYSQHKQQLKQDQDSELLLLTPFQPQIRSAFYSKEKVENRLIQYGQASTSRLEKKRREKMQYEAPARPSPTISTPVHDLADRLINKRLMTERKLEEKRIKKIENESKLNKSPKICKNSLKIVQGLEREGRVEDRLQEVASEINEKIERRKEFQNITNRLNAKPVITDMAKNLKRSGDVSERLNRYKFYYENHLRELSEKYSPARSESRGKGSLVARERLFKPRDRSLSPDIPSFTPSLSQRSMKIAEKLEKSETRLMKPLNKCKNPQEEPDCFFKPAVNPNSCRIDNRKNLPGERWESLYSLKDLHAEKREKLAESFTVLDPECTFKPSISSSRESCSSGFFDRANEWQNKVNLKINEKREAFVKDELSKCTFAPEIEQITLKPEPRTTPKLSPQGYSKKYKQMPANEFLSALEALHLRLHSEN